MFLLQLRETRVTLPFGLVLWWLRVVVWVGLVVFLVDGHRVTAAFSLLSDSFSNLP